MNNNLKIRPVILAGGSGVRLWPLSREAVPKQLLALVGEQSLLQQTMKRVGSAEFLPPIIICNERYRFLIGEQVPAPRPGGLCAVAEHLDRLCGHGADRGQNRMDNLLRAHI